MLHCCRGKGRWAPDSTCTSTALPTASAAPAAWPARGRDRRPAIQASFLGVRKTIHPLSDYSLKKAECITGVTDTHMRSVVWGQEKAGVWGEKQGGWWRDGVQRDGGGQSGQAACLSLRLLRPGASHPQAGEVPLSLALHVSLFTAGKHPIRFPQSVRPSYAPPLCGGALAFELPLNSPVEVEDTPTEVLAAHGSKCIAGWIFTCASPHPRTRSSQRSHGATPC